MCGDDIDQRGQPSHVGVVLMVVGILGLLITFILASTARRTEVVHPSAHEGFAEPLPRDDPRD